MYLNIIIYSNKLLLFVWSTLKKEKKKNDMKKRLEAPKEVYDFITGNKSFSRSGNEHRGEGGDHKTENENKHIKGHLGQLFQLCNIGLELVAGKSRVCFRKRWFKRSRTAIKLNFKV